MNQTMWVFLGAIVGLAVGGAILSLLFKKKVLDFTFDERQERARGQAFKYGFITLAVAVVVYGGAEQFFGRWCEPLAGAMLCVCVGVGAFAIICILKDAYLSLKEKPRQVMTLFVVLSVVNLGFGGVAWADGTLVEDGVLTFRAVNPIVGLLTLVILIVYLVNNALRNKEEAE